VRGSRISAKPGLNEIRQRKRAEIINTGISNG
jgi:hypothetical protein